MEYLAPDGDNNEPNEILFGPDIDIDFIEPGPRRQRRRSGLTNYQIQRLSTTTITSRMST